MNDIFISILLNEKDSVLIQILRKLVPLFQLTRSHTLTGNGLVQSGDKPIPDPMLSHVESPGLNELIKCNNHKFTHVFYNFT